MRCTLNNQVVDIIAKPWAVKPYSCEKSFRHIIGKVYFKLPNDDTIYEGEVGFTDYYLMTKNKSYADLDFISDDGILLDALLKFSPEDVLLPS